MRISDWSSDVCSSDLLARDCDVVDVAFAQTRVGDAHEFGALAEILEGAAAGITHRGLHAADHLVNDVLRGALERHQTGRASCRESVCPYVSISVVAVTLKKKQKYRKRTQTQNT